ncbi:MAG: LysR family transcriptional regulator [Candidatus Saccharimonadales bacterium]
MKFYEVARLKSFSAAAKALGKSQPAITLAIGSLERSLGARLFVRNRYDVELTDEGKLVLASATKILKEDKLLKKGLDALVKNKSRHIGIIDSIAYLLYSSNNSNLLSGLEIMVDSSKKIIRELVADKIDLGLITGQPGYLSKDIKVKKLHTEKFVFVRSPKLKLNKRADGINDWLAFNLESTTFTHFTKQFKRLGLNIQPVFYSTSLDLLKDMAVSGRGTALLPYHMVKADIAARKLVKVKAPNLNRPIWAIVRKRNKSSVDDLFRQVNNLLIDGNSRY